MGWAEVAASWVRAEKASPRFALDYAAASESTADEPEELLRAVRGWPDRGYFAGFPVDVRWYLAEMTPSDLRSVLYIDWGYWLEVTGGTRLPADAIERMGWREWLLPSPAIEPIALVSNSLTTPDRVVVLEGHARLTRYVAAGDRLGENVACWLGVSRDIRNWGCF